MNGAQWALAGPGIRPQAVYRNAKTWLAYQGADWHPYVSMFDHATHAWSAPVQCGTNPLISDSHGSPALLVDAGGYLHVFYGCHVSPMKYAKSAAPYDVSAWVTQSDPVANATYPNVFQLSDGMILLFYRAGGHTDDWVQRTSTNGGQTWSAPQPIIDGESPLRAWYAEFAQYGDAIHCGIVYKDGTNLRGARGPEYTHRYNLSYMRRESSGVWTNAARSTVTIPVNVASVNGSLNVIEPISVARPHTNLPAIAVTSAGVPGMLFIEGSDKTHAIKCAVHTQAGWVTTTVCPDIDHLFDGYALRWVEATTWDAYIVRGGTRGRHGDYDTLLRDRGGNVERWRSVDNGARWSKLGDICAGRYNYPTVVINGHPECRLVVAEWVELDVWTAKVYSVDDSAADPERPA